MKPLRLPAPAALALLAATSASCAFYFPHSVVATNIRTTDRDALMSGSKRVEADVCGNRLLWIPFGPDPRTTTVMAALQDQVTNAVGFEDIRIDVSFVNYIYPLFWQDCVHASAFPLIPVTKGRSSKGGAKGAPAAAEPAAPANESGAAPTDGNQPADPFAN
jgi:hypothetical protein